MSDTEDPPQPNSTGDDPIRHLLGEVWDSLRLIVTINNAFIEQMGAGNDLSETDERRFIEWRNALAKAQEPVLRAQERLMDRPKFAN